MFLVPLREDIEYIFSIGIPPLNQLLDVLHSLLTLSTSRIVEVHYLRVLDVILVHTDYVHGAFSIPLLSRLAYNRRRLLTRWLHRSSTMFERFFGEGEGAGFWAGADVFEVGVAGLGLPVDSQPHEFSIIRVSKNCDRCVVYTDMVYQPSNEEVALFQLTLQRLQSRLLLSQGKVIHSELVLVTLH